MEKIREQLRKIIKGEVKSQELFSRHTSFKIGGPADFWVEPVDVEDLVRLVRFIREKGLRWVVSGNGTNLLVGDRGFSGVVINLKNLVSFTVKQDSIVVSTGVGLKKILDKAVKLGLAGFEFAAGIPGTIGGAVVTNAGGRTGEIGRVVRKVRVLNSRMDMQSLSRAELKFGYRNCELPAGAIIVEVEIELRGGEMDEIGKQVDELLDYRRRTQPLDYPSAGCIFKNPDGKSAGKLIESAGLGGKRVGDAEISTKHANFIINVGRAKALDVITLMEMVEAKIFKQYGIELEREVTVIGT